MGNVFKFFNRIWCCGIIFLLPIDMIVVGRKKAIEDFKLNWNDDGEF